MRRTREDLEDVAEDKEVVLDSLKAGLSNGLAAVGLKKKEEEGSDAIQRTHAVMICLNLSMLPLLLMPLLLRKEEDVAVDVLVAAANPVKVAEPAVVVCVVHARVTKNVVALVVEVADAVNYSDFFLVLFL